MQEGRWTKIGGFFTMIGTIIAIVAFFGGDKDSSTPGGGYENKSDVRSSRSPAPASNSASPRKPVGSSADLNEDGFPEGLIRMCFQQPPICEFEIYDARRNRTIGKLLGDEVSAILPSKTNGYFDIAVLRKKDLTGRAIGSSGTLYIYKWDGESYAQSK